MLLKGFTFPNGSIRLKQQGEWYHVEIFKGKLEEIRYTTTEMHRANSVYGIAKEILADAVGRAFDEAVQMISTYLKGSEHSAQGGQ